MAFTRSADGIAKKGKTEGKNYGDSGPVAKMSRTSPVQHFRRNHMELDLY